MKKIILVLLMLGSISFLYGKDLKVLTIGNSFSYSLKQYFSQVTKSAGDNVEIGFATIGGCSLQKHWDLRDTKAYLGGKYTLKDMLELKKWDVVTLQQVSSGSYKLDTFEPFLGDLILYVKKYSPQSKIMFQETWSYNPQSPRFKSWQIDSATMYELIAKNYATISKKYNIGIIPTGLAVQFTRVARAMLYSNLRMTAKDCHHLSKQGEYLQACVWYATLFDEDADDIELIPNILNKNEAKFLHDIADMAVEFTPSITK